jgi:CBS domain-containing protein
MAAETLVRDAMTTSVATLRPDQSIAEAADELAGHGFGTMPVVDGSNRLLGLLRDEDLIVSEARIHVPTFINFLGATIPLPGSMHHFEEDLHKVAGATVAEVMDDDPVTIGPDATLEDAATLMHDRDVTHLPVVDDGGVVVGIIARGDLVRHIARTT